MKVRSYRGIPTKWILEISPTHQLTGVLSLTVLSAVTRQALAVVATGQVRAVARDAGVSEALVDVDIAVSAFETRAGAVALVAVDQISALALVARVRVAFVDLVLALLPGVAVRADTLVVLKWSQILLRKTPCAPILSLFNLFLLLENQNLI